jgi:predicted DNA-binding protein with PD1-like motif
MSDMFPLLLALTLMQSAAPQPTPDPNYVTRAAATSGLAPGMKVTELSSSTRNFMLVFAKGDEVASGLADFAEKNNIKAAHFTAIGAFDSATFGWFDPAKRAYKKIPLNEEAEVVSFVGNITRDARGRPNVHAHCVVALQDGTTRAGHFVEGRVSLTLQLFIEDAEPLK